MQVTISSDDQLPHVLRAVGALMGVRLSVDGPIEDVAATAQGSDSTADTGGGEGERVTKTRHHA